LWRATLRNWYRAVLPRALAEVGVLRGWRGLLPHAASYEPYERQKGARGHCLSLVVQRYPVRSDHAPLFHYPFMEGLPTICSEGEHRAKSFTVAT